MEGLEQIALWLYGSGDALMVICRIVVLIFVLETFAYIVNIIASISKTALK